MQLRPVHAEGVGDCAQLPSEPAWVHRNRHELVVLAEAGGPLVDRIDNNELPAGAASGTHDCAECDNEELTANTLALQSSIKCKFREQDRRDLAWSSSGLRLCQCLSINRVRRYGKVPSDDSRLVDDCVGSGSLSRGGRGVKPKPGVQLNIARVEGTDVVVIAERLGDVAHAVWMRGWRRARLAAAASRGDGSAFSSRAARSWSK